MFHISDAGTVLDVFLHFSAVCDKDDGGNAWSSSNVPPYYSSESALPSAAYCTTCVLPDSNGDNSSTYWHFHYSYGPQANGDFLFYFRISPHWREPSIAPTLGPSALPTPVSVQSWPVYYSMCIGK